MLIRYRLLVITMVFQLITGCVFMEKIVIKYKIKTCPKTYSTPHMVSIIDRKYVLDEENKKYSHLFSNFLVYTQLFKDETNKTPAIPEPFGIYVDCEKKFILIPALAEKTSIKNNKLSEREPKENPLIYEHNKIKLFVNDFVRFSDISIESKSFVYLVNKNVDTPVSDFLEVEKEFKIIETSLFDLDNM